jgi:hypothetical protein
MKAAGTLLLGVLILTAGLLLYIDFRGIASWFYKIHVDFWKRELYSKSAWRVIAAVMMCLGAIVVIGAISIAVKS